jgi:integrase
MATKQRKHGEGSVWSKPALNNWYLSFYRDGKQVQINSKLPKTEENYAAAEAMLKQEIAKRTLDIKSDALTLAKVKYEDMRDHLIQKFRDNKVASVATTKDGGSYLVGAKYLDLYFAGMSLDKMAQRIAAYPAFVKSQDEVEKAWYERVMRERLYQVNVKKLSAKAAEVEARKAADMAQNATINRSLSTLRSMYGRFAEAFPAKLRIGDIPNMPTIAAVASDNVRTDFTTPETFEKIYAAMPAHLQPLTQFLYFTGMRSGAAKQITWGMVEWEKKGNRKVAVALNLPEWLNKNKKPHRLRLSGPLTSFAETLNNGGFTTVDMPIFNSTNFRRVWNKVCADLGLGLLDKKTQAYIGLHPHDFRRSAARNLVRAGVSETVAQSITGHKSAAMFKRYNIVADADQDDAMTKVGERHSALTQAK